MKRFLFLLFACVSCLDICNPPASIDSLRALVVDGYVDIHGNASVKLSRSVPLNKSEGFWCSSELQVDV